MTDNRTFLNQRFESVQSLRGIAALFVLMQHICFIERGSFGVDIFFLMVGGYISGTSLIGAPLVIAVAAQQVAKEKLRDTLFALWFILVFIKLAAFILADVDLQLIHHLWLLPCAAVGHVVGLKAHRRMLEAETPIFFRVLGVVLLTVSVAGLVQAFL